MSAPTHYSSFRKLGLAVVCAVLLLTACAPMPSDEETATPPPEITVTVLLEPTATPILEQGIFGQTLLVGVGPNLNCFYDPYPCTMPPPAPMEDMELVVFLETSDPFTTTISDALGQYRVPLPPGKYRVCFSDRYVAKTCSPVLTVQPSEYIEYNLEFPTY